jgi:hypothetical protein
MAHAHETPGFRSDAAVRRYVSRRPGGFPFSNPERSFFGRPRPLPPSWTASEVDHIALVRTRLV